MSSGPAWAVGPIRARRRLRQDIRHRAEVPYVIGSDGAGTVADVGDRVKGFTPGDRVYAFGLVNPKGGFYAEYAAVKAEEVSRIPGKLTNKEAGAMPVDAMTALRGLDDTLGLKADESVMIFGASGGIATLPCSWPSAWAPVYSPSLRGARGGAGEEAGCRRGGRRSQGRHRSRRAAVRAPRT